MVKLIGFTGRARSGKTTAARLINSRNIRIINNVTKLQSVRLSFATPLKSMASFLYPEIKESFYGDKTQVHEPSGKTAREILQLLGTEVCRNIYHDTWIDIMDRKVRNHIDKKIITIDDIRFDNEFDFVRNHKGTENYMIGVVRGSDKQDKHKSEDVDALIDKCDYVVYNDGSRDDYINSLRDTLLKIGAY